MSDLLLIISLKVVPMQISLRGINEKVQTILHMNAQISIMTGGGILFWLFCDNLDKPLLEMLPFLSCVPVVLDSWICCLQICH